MRNGAVSLKHNGTVITDGTPDRRCANDKE